MQAYLQPLPEGKGVKEAIGERRKDAALVFNTKIRCVTLATKIFRNDSYFLKQLRSIMLSIYVN